MQFHTKIQPDQSIESYALDQMIAARHWLGAYVEGTYQALGLTVPTDAMGNGPYMRAVTTHYYPCICGKPVACVDGAYASADGLFCSQKCLDEGTHCTSTFAQHVAGICDDPFYCYGV